ncbi:MAG: hypothetical protein P1U47_11330 [Zhongshania sp.]|uniref:hypothetical protein n=1 Tax=Zhongshania sp. TaxID=1971902 RepID=UPI0026124931|nr:hypothetical protein [Zhongshania sp.]MDF1692961.1 hypothetical protein [Zhongshania sp.]
MAIANSNKKSLLNLSGNYQVGSDSNWPELLDDANLILDSVVCALRSIADGSENEMQAEAIRGISYLAEFSKNVVTQAHSIALADRAKQFSPKSNLSVEV